jgi:PAS domain S-box-containing protein
MPEKKRRKAAAKIKKNARVLRKRAEDRLNSQPDQEVLASKSSKSPAQLVHELQVYQVELEMQNDELRRSQEALEEEKSRFATIFNFAPVGFVVLDQATVVEDCNEMALTLLNTEKRDLIGKRFQKLILPECGDQFYLFVKKLIESGKAGRIQLPFVNADGQRFYGQVQGSMVQNSAGSGPAYYMTIVDITEKHLADLKLQETTERLQIALKASLSGILTIDLKSGLVQPDEFVMGLFGLGAGEFDGRLATLYKCIVAEDVDRIDPVIRKAISESGNLNEIFRIEKKNGEIRHVEVHGKSVSIESRNDIFIGLITDITKKESLRIQSELLKMNQQSDVLRTILKTQEEERVRISNALHDSLGQLLYSASLKLQNSSAHNDLFFTQSLSLLDQAIRETRKISFELAPSVLSDYGIAVAVTEMASRITSNALVIEAKITGLNKRLPLEVETDIFRILQELVNNVVKHAGASKAQIRISKSGTRVNISVQDDGNGFNQEQKAGSGTGLSSIRNRISLYGGTMKIASRTGQGTIVNLKLDNIRELQHVAT